MVQSRRRNPTPPTSRPTTRSRSPLRNRKVQHRRTRRPTVSHASLRSCRSGRYRPNRHRRRRARRSRSPHRTIHRQHRPLRRRNVRLRSERSRRCQITRAVEHHHIIRNISRLRHPRPAIGHPNRPRSTRRPLRPCCSRRPRNPGLCQYRPKRRAHIRLPPNIRCGRHVTRPAIPRHASHPIRRPNQPSPLKTGRRPRRSRRPLSPRRSWCTRSSSRALKSLWPRCSLRRQQSPERRTLIRSVPHISHGQRYPGRPRITHSVMQPIIRRR
jgi:hypothetical protein